MRPYLMIAASNILGGSTYAVTTAALRGFAEKALREGRITLDESRQILRVYEAGLAGYTYLEREVDAKSFTATQLKLVPTSDVAVKTGT